MNTNYFVLCAAALVMFAACQKEENAAPKVSLTASLEQQIDNNTTKTALGTENTVVWSEGDVIKVHGASGVEELTLSGGAGTTTGVFGATTVTNPDYAIYPASAYSSISSSTVTFTLPAIQTYAENSFGPGANVAVAAISGSNMPFKNVCGVLKLQLKGSMKVSKIELTGKNGEKLNGTFTVDAAANPFVGAVPTTGDPTDDEKKVTLDCSHFGETSEGAADGGVQLGFETATKFDIVVPVSAFTGGFDAKITDALGDTFFATLETTGNNNIARSTITRMPTKGVSLLPNNFKELGYLKNLNGSARINTGISGNNDNLTVGIKFLFDTYVQYGAVYSNYKDASSNSFRIILGQFDNNTLFYNCNSDAGNYGEIINMEKNVWHNIVISPSFVIADGVKFGKPSQAKSGVNETPIYVLGTFNNSMKNIGLKVCLWYAKNESNDMLRYLLAARRNEDNVLGMYDLISNQFLVNDRLSGTLEAGPELTD